MTKIYASEFDQSRFFKSADVERELKKLGKREYLHTVKSVTKEKMQDGSEKLVVWCNEDRRGLVLSAKTNIRAFSGKYDDDVEDWIDAPYAMFVGQAHNPSTGTTGPALRVRVMENGAGPKPRKKTAKKKAA